MERPHLGIPSAGRLAGMALGLLILLSSAPVAAAVTVVTTQNDLTLRLWPIATTSRSST